MPRIFPNEFYMFPTGVAQISSKKDSWFTTKKIELTEDGILQYIDGKNDTLIPQRGFPDSDAILACAVSKRLLITLLSMRPLMLPTIKNLEKILANYNDVSLKVLNDYIFLYQTPVADEFKKIIYRFLLGIKVKEQIAFETSIIISTLFEYDNAYRFRLQDLFTATTKEYLIKHPYKGILNLLKIQKERDHLGVHKKFALIKPIATLVLLIPKFRKAYVSALSQSDFSRLQFDDIDEYWVAQRVDYKFFGESQSQLKKRLRGRKLPKKSTMKEIQNGNK